MIDATDSWLSQVKHVLNNGELARDTYEILASQLRWKMERPLIMVSERKLNYRFAAAEAAYIISGQNRVKYLTDVMKSFADYSTDDGIFQAGSYGPPFVDQLPYVIKCLCSDPSSRQAVISIWRPRPMASKDIPCTLTLQYIIRNNVLHCIVNMRSSDVWRGLTYDMFCFSCMGAVVAHYCGVSLGAGYIHAGSSHIYIKDKASALSLVGYTSEYEQSPLLAPARIEDLYEDLDIAAHKHDNEECLEFLKRVFHE